MRLELYRRLRSSPWTGNDLATRARSAEWMDATAADPAQLRDSLAFIRRVNRLLGYNRATLNCLKRFSRRWGPGARIRLLDVATGSADVPMAILRWVDRVNRRRGFRWDMRIVAIDLHPRTLAIAAEQAGGDRRVSLLRADALRLPFADGTFDYAITGMFLHHLSDAEAAKAVAEMNRCAGKGIVVADLLRSRAAMLGIRAVTLFSNPMVRHDAVASVAQAFSRREAMALRDAAGVEYARYRERMPARFVIAGEKGDAPNPLGDCSLASK